ncbi:MAG: porin family protein [Zetaproteobacteria bacterium CG02_land_8_20_14_3_00_50_9]|nr:MAG: hypothetical protein COW62_12865 [Zetaproteobacteria bacterium CG17_big_fil_post_rev_8_21_14_2_50_50_13]PIV29179.1 MAG: porin family protein [Zetaproteobacteria bacterium CG02_land_8_20_14_3_00_50_9]
MKLTLKIAFAASLLMAFSGTAQATDSYVGLGLGIFNMGNGVTKKAAPGAYLQLGNTFMENLGAEIRIGASSTTGEELTLQPRMKMKSFVAAYLKPQYQINDQFTAYGLLGMAQINGSYSEGVLPKQNKSRSGFSYGLGMQYNVSSQYSIGAELSQMLSKPNANATTVKTNFQGLNAGVYTVNAQYHF